jgi:hypothetical protein
LWKFLQVFLLIPDKTMTVKVLTEAYSEDFDPGSSQPAQARSGDKNT